MTYESTETFTSVGHGNNEAHISTERKKENREDFVETRIKL